MHKFRFGLGAKWRQVTIENDSVQFYVGEKLLTEIPVDKIETIQISKQVGGVFAGKISSHGKSIKFNTNAPEEVATPYQAVDTYAEFLEALKEHPKNVAEYIVGSNWVLFFGFIMLAIAVIGLIMSVALLGRSGGRTLKMLVTSIAIGAVSIPMITGGRAKREKSLEFLPYGL